MGYDFERYTLGYAPWASWIRAPGAVEDPPWARLKFNFNTPRNKNTASESMPARTTVTPWTPLTLTPSPCPREQLKRPGL